MGQINYTHSKVHGYTCGNCNLGHLGFHFQEFSLSHKTKKGTMPFPHMASVHLLVNFHIYPFTKLSQKYGDVMELKLGSIFTVVISSPDQAKEVLQIHDPLLLHNLKV